MSDNTARKPVLNRNWTLALLAVCAGGLLFFIVAAAGKTPLRAWQAYLINWIFWSGMAQGGVVFAAILEVTDSHWGRPIKRIAETLAAFLPVSFVLFVLMWPGMVYLYPWVEAPVPGLEVWLNPGFVFGRDILALLLLYGVSFAFVYHSIRPDLGADKLEKMPGASLRAWWSRNWRGNEDEITFAASRRKKLAVALIIVYGFVYSLLGFDLVMSLDPMWYSTLFGAYIFMVNLFGAMAMVALLSIGVRKTAGIEGAIGEPQFHNQGNLLLGFCLLSLYFFWSQFLVIWYGNLTEETGFIIVRAFEYPWKTVTWIVLFGGFMLPFILLLRRGMKTNPGRLFAVSLWIVVMIWLERFILVAPSSWTGGELPLGILEGMVTAGYGALFFLTFGTFLDRIPVRVADPVFTGGKVHHHVLGESDRL